MNLTEDQIRAIVLDAMHEILFSEDEYSPFNRLNDKVNQLLEVNRSEERMAHAVGICDKFEDYMKNIDKLNLMVNEFKGVVSIVRGEGKRIEKENEKLRTQLRKLLGILAE